MQPTLEPHHASWLEFHPNRNAQWLKDMLKEGFDVHHIDGNHGNNEPRNLVLIEHLDHIRLHGAVMERGRLGFVKKKAGKRKPRPALLLPDGRTISLYRGERRDHVLVFFREHPHSPEWDRRAGRKAGEVEQPKGQPRTKAEINATPYDKKLAYRDMWQAASKA